MLQDRLPVVAAFLPIYESLLKGMPKGGSITQDGSVVEPPQIGTHQPDKESGFDSMGSTGGLFDQFLQDTSSMGTAFPFSFPFGNLFEDVFLGAPMQPPGSTTP
jgi:hypothetical protein